MSSVLSSTAYSVIKSPLDSTDYDKLGFMSLSRRQLLAGSVALLAKAAPTRRLSQQDPQVDRLLPTLTLDEKIGQMTQPDQSNSSRIWMMLSKLHAGSVLSGGDSDPEEGNGLASLDRPVRSPSIAALPGSRA